MSKIHYQSKIKSWIQASRLHTLPLAFACIALGNFIAYHEGFFDFSIAILTSITAVFLQVLSSIANDFGDARHGADNNQRKGPKRMVDSGFISRSEMKTGIVIFMFLSLISGVLLLLISVKNIGSVGAMILFVLGLFAIAAAIAYTASNKPYGYRGLGDISVFIFFGLLAVLGSYYLQSGVIHLTVFLPSAGMGLLSTGVLNVNNIRDIEADSIANKNTIPIKIGEKKAKLYHWALMILPIILFTAFLIINYKSIWQFAFMAPALLLIANGYFVSKSKTPEQISPYLRQLVLSVSLFIISYGLCLVLF